MVNKTKFLDLGLLLSSLRYSVKSILLVNTLQHELCQGGL